MSPVHRASHFGHVEWLYSNEVLGFRVQARHAVARDFAYVPIFNDEVTESGVQSYVQPVRIDEGAVKNWGRPGYINAGFRAIGNFEVYITRAEKQIGHSYSVAVADFRREPPGRSCGLIRFDDYNNNFAGIPEYDFDDISHYQNNILNEDPNFKEPFENDLIIGEESAGKNMADSSAATQIPLDVLGVNRVTMPDIGAYQHIIFE